MEGANDFSGAVCMKTKNTNTFPTSLKGIVEATKNPNKMQITSQNQ